MNDKPVNVLFPVSRYVSGDMYMLGEKKDPNTKQVKTYAPGHTKAGQAMLECYFAIAVPKAPGQQHWAAKPADWETNPVTRGTPYWGETIWLLGNAAFPGLVDQTRGYITLATFAWKIEDGDSTVPKGEYQTRNCDKEGHAGNWIVHLKSGYLPKIYNSDGTQVLLEPGAVKRGFYVEVLGNVQSNDNKQKPGVYINHSMVAFRGIGDEIRSGPDPRTVGFGKAALPPGAGTASSAATFPAATGTPGLPPPGGPLALPAGVPSVPAAQGVPGLPQTPTSPSSAPLAVTPHPGILTPPAGAPLAPRAPTAPQVPAGPIMKIAGVTWDMMVQQGWNEATARQAGHIV